jgi:hypothetical protein
MRCEGAVICPEVLAKLTTTVLKQYQRWIEAELKKREAGKR